VKKKKKLSNRRRKNTNFQTIQMKNVLQRKIQTFDYEKGKNDNRRNWRMTVLEPAQTQNGKCRLRLRPEMSDSLSGFRTGGVKKRQSIGLFTTPRLFSQGRKCLSSSHFRVMTP